MKKKTGREHTQTHTLTKMKQSQMTKRQAPNGQTHHWYPMFHQLTMIRGDFHQPRGGGTSDEQGELDTRVQDRHFTLLCGENRSHQSMTFHIYTTTTDIQTQKKKNTHVNASSIHSINASHIHSLLNASYIFKRIIHSSHKTHRTFTHFS